MCVCWGTVHDAAFRDLRDTERRPCCLRFTDAQGLYWLGIVMQVPLKYCYKKIQELKHKQMDSLGGILSGSQRHWSPYGKEAFVIVQTFADCIKYRWDHYLCVYSQIIANHYLDLQH